MLRSLVCSNPGRFQRFRLVEMKSAHLVLDLLRLLITPNYLDSAGGGQCPITHLNIYVIGYVYGAYDEW